MKIKKSFSFFLAMVLINISLLTSASTAPSEKSDYDAWLLPAVTSEEETAMQALSEEIRRQGWQLYDLYKDELQNETHFMWLMMQASIDTLTLQADGQRLLSDLLACTSAQAFSDVMRGSYLHITEAPEGQPSQKAVIEVVEQVAANAGFLDLPYSMCVKVPYQGANTDIWIGYLGDYSDDSFSCLTITFDPTLNVNAMSYRPQELVTDSAPLTPESKTRLRGLIETFLQKYIDTDEYKSLDLSKIIYSDTLLTDQEAEYAYIFVPYATVNRHSQSTTAEVESYTLWAFFRINMDDMAIYEYSARVTKGVLDSLLSEAP